MLTTPTIIPAFNLGTIPRIIFGVGTRNQLPSIIAELGDSALLVTGARSLAQSPHWPALRDELARAGLRCDITTIEREPSPADIDNIVQRYYAIAPKVVVAVGGGSVLDAGKAIAGLLPFGNSVLDHLEGVGRGIPYHGPALPFIALPTTAGTGSEATKNAVLGVVGAQGYKKSFRHDSLVSRYAIVDPAWLETCPASLIAANGMDALTQLLESFVSARANPITDALAESGLYALATGLLPAWRGGTHAAAQTARSQIAYGALLSGITLAHAGLGAVHGLAAPLGAFFPIPHGVACGSTLVAATRVNLAALHTRLPDHPSCAKYARAGRLLAGDGTLSDQAATDALLACLTHLHAELRMPRLRDFGVQHSDIARIVAHSRGNSMQTNPVLLTDAEIATILTASC